MTGRIEKCAQIRREAVKRIYDWDAQPRQRNHAAADLRELKGKRRLTQTTANSAETAAARDAGIDLIIGNAHNTAAVRDGAFLGPAETAGMPQGEFDSFMTQLDAR